MKKDDKEMYLCSAVRKHNPVTLKMTMPWLLCWTICLCPSLLITINIH